MKNAVLFTAAAGLVSSAMGQGLHRRHGHDIFHRRGGDMEAPAAPSCGCTTKVITYYGEPSLSTPPPMVEPTTTLHSTSYTTKTVEVSPSKKEEPLPTARVTTYPTPGTYTVEPTTIVVPSETTVCDATSTGVQPGEHTYGGVTTVVEEATTVTCPIATVKPTGDTSTSVVETTTYVCPSGGTYTIAPSTTSVDKSTVLVYPTPATYTPGTYTQPGQTVTVDVPDFIFICPTNEATTTPAPASTSAPASSAAAATPTETSSGGLDLPIPDIEIDLPKIPKPSDLPKPSDIPKPDLGGDLIGGKGDKLGITYSPYTKDGQCKEAGQVAKDVASIKKAGFTTVRIYAPNCDGLQNVSDACEENDMKMIIGVFIDSKGIQGAEEQIDQIVKWGKFDMCELIVVGNEALFSKVIDATGLAGLIKKAKSSFESAGYKGPVTTTETLNIWQESSNELCSAVDVVGANIHPFFNTAVDALGAGKFVKGQMDILGELCGGKEVLNLETGWPSSGDSNGKAIPGIAQQLTAITSIVKEVGSKSVFMSFDDEEWKDAGPFNIEQSWGCFKNFLNL